MRDLDIPWTSPLSPSLSSSSCARPLPFPALVLFALPEGMRRSSGKETLRGVSAVSRDGPASADGEGGTISTPPIPPDEGIRSRVLNPRSTPTRGPRSTGAGLDSAGSPLRDLPDCFSFSLANCDGGEGEGVSGVWFSTNSAMRLRTQSRALAPHAQVVNVDAREWSMEVIWLRNCCIW